MKKKLRLFLAIILVLATVGCSDSSEKYTSEVDGDSSQKVQLSDETSDSFETLGNETDDITEIVLSDDETNVKEEKGLSEDESENETNLITDTELSENEVELDVNDNYEQVKGTVILSDHVMIPFNSSMIPEYSGQPFIDVDYQSDLSNMWDRFEDANIHLSSFDSLGRCGSAVMYASSDMLPTQTRGATGDIKPTGWVQNAYPEIIDSDPPYLYNRAHLLAWSISGLTDTSQNLITGTRYLNEIGMMSVESEILKRIEEGDDLLYRVTPIYSGDNLLADGVLMEAENRDGSFSICRFVYNVQPGIEIDYTTGDNCVHTESEAETQQTEDTVKEDNTTENVVVPKSEPIPAGTDYVLNTNTHKFHYPWCSSVSDMKEHNKKEYTGTREEVINMGYDPCKRCNP